MPSLPSEIGGIPLWGILFAIAGILLFLLKMSAGSTDQDRYPTTRLFLYIAAIFIAVVGFADLVRWANLW
jgi:hypothetical protein